MSFLEFIYLGSTIFFVVTSGILIAVVLLSIDYGN